MDSSAGSTVNDRETPGSRLRDAGIRALGVLAGADDAGPGDASVKRVLADLGRALDGLDPVGTDTQPVLDPARHSLSAIDYRGRHGRPITLRQRALDVRALLEAERETVDDRVVITSMRGLVIGNLLRELASRLGAGEAFGAGEDGADLAIVALDIAEWLNDMQSGYLESEWAERTPMPLPTTVDPVAEEQRLRTAAGDVLAAFGDTAGDPSARRDALVALHAAIRGPIPQLRKIPGRIPGDASYHLLWALEPAAILKEPPTTLLGEAEHTRDSLAKDRAVTERRDGDFNLEFGEPRALACAALLDEFSARLRPGAAFGPGRDGIPLAAIADELAESLRSQTVLGSR
ncbi:hypothetical protein ACWDOP_04640 [Nocardia sp. NPDC003693]